MTSCAFKMHRESGPSLGKPVLICILACSLAFHAITSECSYFYENRRFKNKASVALNPMVSLFYLFVAQKRFVGRKCGNRRTDKQSTVTLACSFHRSLGHLTGRCAAATVSLASRELNEGVWSPQPSLACTASTEQSSLASTASTEQFLSTLCVRC